MKPPYLIINKINGPRLSQEPIEPKLSLKPLKPKLS